MIRQKVKINERDGYAIFYDPERQLFCLHDAEGNEVATAGTQEKVEQEISKLAKQAFNLPIPAILARSYGIDRGRITSLNPHNKTAYFSYDKKDYGRATKIALSYDKGFYELTKANEKIAKQIEERMVQKKELDGEIEALKDQFEKPINREYFGLP